MVGVATRKELAADLRAVFAAAPGSALGIASSMVEKLRQKGYSKVADQVEECLSCLAFPKPHRRRIRTTNGLERLSQEIKRRRQVVRLSGPGGVLKTRDGVGRRAVEGMDDGQALP